MKQHLGSRIGTRRGPDGDFQRPREAAGGQATRVAAEHRNIPEDTHKCPSPSASPPGSEDDGQRGRREARFLASAPTHHLSMSVSPRDSMNAEPLSYKGQMTFFQQLPNAVLLEKVLFVLGKYVKLFQRTTCFKHSSRGLLRLRGILKVRGWK